MSSTNRLPRQAPSEQTSSLPVYDRRLPSLSADAKPHVAQQQFGRAKALETSTPPPKILLYSHDTFGLGNIRRTLLLAEELRSQYPGASILIITGSPMIHAFRIPEGVDYIKLPCLDRIAAERYTPRFLTQCNGEVKATRAAILKHSVLGFAPDLMIVDKRAAGVDGELLEALTEIRACNMQTKLVLGVRDILDEPERTREVLHSNGSFATLERFYDEIWIYGSQSIFDTARVYGFPESLVRRTFYCGYLKRPTMPSTRTAGPPHVLVTTGGGGDGSDIIETYLIGLSSLTRSVALKTTVIFGPQMPESRRENLLARFGHFGDVTFLDFDPDLTKHYAASDVVVAQAGYNTVCELLSFSQRAILVPRAEPVREQLIRARLLAKRGYFDLVEPKDLNPGLLISTVLCALRTAPRMTEALDLDGLPRIRERVANLLSKPNE